MNLGRSMFVSGTCGHGVEGPRGAVRRGIPQASAPEAAGLGGLAQDPLCAGGTEVGLEHHLRHLGPKLGGVLDPASR